MRTRRLLTTLALALTTALSAAGAVAQAGDWVSYRDAYRAMVRFEKYGGPKNLLTNLLQVVPREPGELGDGAQLTLTGRSVQLNLPLDALGRTVFPLQKVAYDENAALALNRKGVAFTVRPQVALAPRADGRYDAAELRAGCAQALDLARWAGAALGTHGCAGVRFVYAKKAAAAVRLRRADGGEAPLQPSEAAGATEVVFRFGADAQRAQVVTVNAPLAILPLIEGPHGNTQE
jgi:hypothetical protein